MTPVPRILVVDDEPAICRNCMKMLAKLTCEAAYALTGYDALQMMNETPFDVVVTDLKMSMMGGMEVLRRIKEDHPQTVVVVMTGFASISSAVEVMKMGAFDYLPKPFTPQEFRGSVLQALERRSLRKQNHEGIQRKKNLKTCAHQLIGDSPQIRQVVAMIQKVAPTDSTVLICGESGTGKELVARAVYANSTRKQNPFFAIDCGTLSSGLLESELFGHVKGAFTGAHRDKEGIFSLAHGGTLFLDEISNISLDVQSKLLRFLETREFMPLGDTRTHNVDVRLILATNKNLKDLVEAGLFREDFYYRIFVYPILIPPLRDRRQDIVPIAYHFLNQCTTRMGKNILGFDHEAAERLASFDWPGNVRQLRNVVERAVIGCETDRITARDVSLSGIHRDAVSAKERIPETNEAFKRLKKDIRRQAITPLEKNFILNALMKNDWNITQAARWVGLQRTNFQGLMKKHGIVPPKRPPSV